MGISFYVISDNNFFAHKMEIIMKINASIIRKLFTGLRKEVQFFPLIYIFNQKDYKVAEIPFMKFPTKILGTFNMKVQFIIHSRD